MPWRYVPITPRPRTNGASSWNRTKQNQDTNLVVYHLLIPAQRKLWWDATVLARVPLVKSQKHHLNACVPINYLVFVRRMYTNFGQNGEPART